MPNATYFAVYRDQPGARAVAVSPSTCIPAPRSDPWEERRVLAAGCECHRRYVGGAPTPRSRRHPDVPEDTAAPRRAASNLEWENSAATRRTASEGLVGSLVEPGSRPVAGRASARSTWCATPTIGYGWPFEDRYRATFRS